MKRSLYEGLQQKIRTLKTPCVDVWKNQYQDRDYIIRIDIPEFTCICPKTGLPDFASIVIKYIPDKRCIELKSLKYYMLFYRDVGIFNENVVNKMLDDLVGTCEPRWMEVFGEFNARGGIKTTVTAEYGKKPVNL
ncbi:MAG: preQ(1) synthase [Candidatus Omnitrophica bacterium]|nr:preQ(1) synthase [Candidatus Omnitrophota bacterium]MBU0881779.1 preQ(1) synthase [Candidatus Omnitrophota bacterium]MBU0895397.1 preQ(1) synthase [Candidatus Omnitrophota bacterium]MBU1038028.1 preQ(1) synthase [Candidatus Omnitrophota bacterium]MBU1808910.1 preQ(1) synthase [Candidatus Omnitrophota bacterium]